MHEILKVQKRLLPDLIEVMQKRYQILRYIQLMQPVGRRSLSQNLHITERVLRGEILFLKDQNLVSISNSGMSLTEEGKILLGKLDQIMKDISGVPEFEKQLQRQFHLKGAVVVSGNSDESPWVKSELGRACVKSMKTKLEEHNIIAVTGGSTIATVAEAITPDLGKKKLLFVPARGGFGTDIAYQANSLCAKMAEVTNSEHLVLYVPEQVSDDVYQSFIQEPVISEVLSKIKSANILIHGIGDAISMAKRRNTSDEDLEKIIQGGAIAEAFGYYFNEDGEIVHRTKTVGIQLEDLHSISHIFAVAGGESKAKAIKAYLKVAPPNTILVTDEIVANLILKG